MALSYSAFKTYVLANLWRTNDTDLSNNLDQLITQANDELDKITRDFQRRQKTSVIAPESQDFDLSTNVSDFQAIQSLTNNETGFYRDSGPEFQQVTLQRIYQLRTQQSSPTLQPFYAVDRDDGTLYLRLVGPFSASDPGDMTLVYRIGVPDYATADSSWMEDEYFNLYLYTVFKHCAIFLREDERIKVYAEYQKDAYESADQDDKHNLQFGGSPLRVQPHRVVP